MQVIVTAPRSELATAIAAAHHDAPEGRGRPVLLSIALQPPNTLLHDGHLWWRDAPRQILSLTRRAIAEAQQQGTRRIVHASYGFLGAAQAGREIGPRLAPIAEATLEAEQLVLDAPIPSTVIRLGYLYGPRSRDLLAYRRALRLHRPYWAGPGGAQHWFVHTDDAAQALLQAAQRAPRQRLVYATDDLPASFGDFIDHLAHLVGRRHPMRIPQLAALPMRLVIRPVHMEMCALGVPGEAQPRLPGFHPRHPDHRTGLAAVVESWAASTARTR